jgi:hypothetical protein
VGSALGTGTGAGAADGIAAALGLLTVVGITTGAGFDDAEPNAIAAIVPAAAMPPPIHKVFPCSHPPRVGISIGSLSSTTGGGGVEGLASGARLVVAGMEGATLALATFAAAAVGGRVLTGLAAVSGGTLVRFGSACDDTLPGLAGANGSSRRVATFGATLCEAACGGTLDARGATLREAACGGTLDARGATLREAACGGTLDARGATLATFAAVLTGAAAGGSLGIFVPSCSSSACGSSAGIL